MAMGILNDYERYPLAASEPQGTRPPQPAAPMVKLAACVNCGVEYPHTEEHFRVHKTGLGNRCRQCAGRALTRERKPTRR